MQVRKRTEFLPSTNVVERLKLEINSEVLSQEWNKRLRKEGYTLDRQINGIKREELKVTRSIKEAAKKGDKDVCK